MVQSDNFVSHLFPLESYGKTVEEQDYVLCERVYLDDARHLA